MNETQYQWIWLLGALDEKNEYVCFRRNYPPVESKHIYETLQISADSRYFLYINGKFRGTGPGRFWPESPWLDSYNLEDENNTEQELCIAVLVWHYGISTSQYIHDVPGLTVRGLNRSDEIEFQSDSSWKCTRHMGYHPEVPRINISQPWMEDFDARAFPSDWMMPYFNDQDWSFARDVSPDFQNRKPQISRIPLLQSEIKKPADIIYQRTVNHSGQGIRIDYKEAFYPGDKSTEDKLHSGFLVSCLHSEEKQTVILTLLDRKWPLETETFVINGKLYKIPPHQNDLAFPINKGDNLFMMDLSGAWQRLWVDFHFKTETLLTLIPPLPEFSSPFAAFGPVETLPIGNIVCSDGFHLDSQDPEYRGLLACRSLADLIPFRKMVHPGIRIFRDLPKHLSFGAVTVTTVSESSEASPERRIRIPHSLRGDRELLLDMGEEVSGFLELTLESSEEAIMDILFFEFLRPGNIPEIPSDLDTSLRLTAEKTPVKFRSILRRGFRYMLVTLRSRGDVILSDLRVDQRLYPVNKQGRFQCSDTELSEIDKLCIRTLTLSREDCYVDSSAFEQALWLGDVKAMAESNRLVFGDTQITGHSLLLAVDSLKESPLPDCHLPAGIHLQLTAWSLFWVLTATEHIDRNSNPEFQRQIYPALSRTLHHFISLINAEGLLETAAWNMLDWGGMDTPYRGLIAHQNALLVKSLEETAALPSASEKERKYFLDHASTIRKAINTTFWSRKQKAYRDCLREDGSPSPVFSIPTHLMMLYSGCVPNERLQEVKDFILNPPKGAVPCGSPFLAGFLLDFLFRQGLTDRALNLIRDLWGSMLEEGSTTCWETFRGFYKDRLTRSYCHGWSCTPAELFRRYILGFSNVSGSPSSIIISPQPGSLKTAEGTIPLSEGLCTIFWCIRENQFDCTVTIPPGCKAEIIPPEGFLKGFLELKN